MNKLDIPNAMMSINSWLGHSSHCNSYKLQNKVLNSCKFLYTDNSNYSEVENDLISLITN